MLKSFKVEKMVNGKSKTLGIESYEDLESAIISQKKLRGCGDYFITELKTGIEYTVVIEHNEMRYWDSLCSKA